MHKMIYMNTSDVFTGENTLTTPGYMKNLVSHFICIMWEWITSGITYDILEFLFMQEEKEPYGISDTQNEDIEFESLLFESILLDMQCKASVPR